MNPEVRPASGCDEFSTPERCHICEVANDPSDPALSIARARVDPGVTTQWHRLRDTEERYLIVSGTGRVELRGLEPTEVGPGDVVRIPAGCPQRITNVSELPLVFYAMCTPRFVSDCYEVCEP